MSYEEIYKEKMDWITDYLEMRRIYGAPLALEYGSKHGVTMQGKQEAEEWIEDFLEGEDGKAFNVAFCRGRLKQIRAAATYLQEAYNQWPDRFETDLAGWFYNLLVLIDEYLDSYKSLDDDIITYEREDGTEVFVVDGFIRTVMAFANITLLGMDQTPFTKGLLHKTLEEKDYGFADLTPMEIQQYVLAITILAPFILLMPTLFWLVPAAVIGGNIGLKVGSQDELMPGADHLFALDGHLLTLQENYPFGALHMLMCTDPEYKELNEKLGVVFQSFGTTADAIERLGEAWELVADEKKYQQALKTRKAETDDGEMELNETDLQFLAMIKSAQEQFSDQFRQ